MKIPDEGLWGDWQADLDTANAYRVLHGKSINEVADQFAENPIEIAEALRFAPCQVAAIYLRGCMHYLASGASQQNADAASSLLHLSREMVRKCPLKLFSPVASFLDSLQALSERQSFYGADPEVYGSFLDIVSDIKASVRRKQ